MKIESNQKDYRFDHNSTNGRGSFHEHDEQMKAFCRSHSNIALVNSPWCDKLSTLETTYPLQLHRTMTETGGSRLINGIADWSALVLVLEVRRHKFWQN